MLAFALAVLVLSKWAVENDLTSANVDVPELKGAEPTREEIEYLFKSDMPTHKLVKRLQHKYLRDEHAENPELRAVRVSVQLMGVALLVSAFVQGNVYSLDVYHALLVLDLCWLNNITAVVLYLTELYLRNPRADFLRRPLPRKLWTWDGIRRAGPFLPTSAYLTAIGAYGVWLFRHILTYGNSDSYSALRCNPLVKYWILGHAISVTARGFRIAGVILHAIAVLPLLNVLAESLILCWGARSAVLVVFLPYRLFQRSTGRKLSLERHALAPQYRHVHLLRTLVALAVIYVFLVVCLVLDSEEMIAANQSLLSEDEESEWTFGQTLVMVLLLPVIWEVGRKGRELYVLVKEKREEDGVVEKAVLKLREERSRTQELSEAEQGFAGPERNDRQESGPRDAVMRAQVGCATVGRC